MRLPRDAEQILGIERESGQLMKLIKPTYGLCDAPRAWYEEATERILRTGKGTIIQHSLDACLFLAYDQDPHQAHAHGIEPELIGMFGIHVDDLFGCLKPNNKHAERLQQSLMGVFSFRERLSGDHLENCGCQIDKKAENHWHLNQEKYIHKQKPIAIAKDRQNNESLPVTESERTQLRGSMACNSTFTTSTSSSFPAGWGCDPSNHQDLAESQRSPEDGENKCGRWFGVPLPWRKE